MTETNALRSTLPMGTTPRRGSLPTPSKLSKILSPVSLSLSIDNPLVFLHPHRQTLEPFDNDRSTTANATDQPHWGSPSPYSSTDLLPNRHLPIDRSIPSYDNRTNNSTIDQQPSKTVISGTLVLKLQRPREIKKITVSLWGQSFIGFNDRPYEHQTILSRDLEIDLPYQLSLRDQHSQPVKTVYNPTHKTYVLEKGFYQFSWSFILPSELPPYERGQFGRTIHKVIGKVKFGGLVGQHEIESESYFVAVCNPATDDGEANGELALNFNISSSSEHLGPYTLSASSAYFTVAGLIQFKLRLNQIPALGKKVIKIYKIKAVVKQQYRLISIFDRDPKTQSKQAESWPPAQRRKIFTLDHTNVGESDEDWHPDWSLEDSNPLQISTRSMWSSTPSSETPPPPPPLPPTPPDPNPSSRSTSRSRSRIRNLLMSSSSRHRTNPSSPSRGEHDDRNQSLPNPSSPPHTWATSLSNLIGGGSRRREDEILTQNGSSSSSRPRRTRTNRSHSLSSHPQPIQDPPPPLPLNPFSNDQPSSVVVPNPREQRSFSTSTSIDTPNQDRIKQQRGRSSQVRRPILPSSSGRRGSKGVHEPEIPLVTITEDHSSWEIQHIGRLPDDDTIRPSTHPGTQTNIHIFHTLLFEISYAVEDEDGQHEPINRILSIGKPVEIVSCCCMLESMVLPPYSKLDPNAEIVQHRTPQHAARMFKCVCGMSTEKLLKTQNPNSSDELPDMSRTDETNDVGDQDDDHGHTQHQHHHHHHGDDDGRLLRRTTTSRLQLRSLPYSNYFARDGSGGSGSGSGEVGSPTTTDGSFGGSR